MQEGGEGRGVVNFSIARLLTVVDVNIELGDELLDVFLPTKNDVTWQDHKAST